MKAFVTYQRLEPNTLEGDVVELKVRYSSFNAPEIDQLEETLRESYKSGIVIEFGEKDNEVPVL